MTWMAVTFWDIFFFLFGLISFSFNRDYTRKTTRRQRQRVWTTVRPQNINLIHSWRTSVRLEKPRLSLGLEGFPTVRQMTVNLNYICFIFQAKYKDLYVKNILGHYVGSFEDPYHTHCMKVAAQNSDVSLKTMVHASQWHCLRAITIMIYFWFFSLQKSYKAEYEEDKGKCYFPQTITQEYEAIKKLDQCKDVSYLPWIIEIGLGILVTSSGKFSRSLNANI